MVMLMTTALTLADLTGRTGLGVLTHLEQEVVIPVLSGLQAQGDLVVIPSALLEQDPIAPGARWREVPPAGIELLRSAGGGNPHTLVADPGSCRWTTSAADPTRLALGALSATAPAYLIHPEHGGAGIAPGIYLVRRQRERSGSPPAPDARPHRLRQDRRWGPAPWEDFRYIAD